MWRGRIVVLGISVALAATGAAAAEHGVVIRAGDIKAQPFIDAASAASVTANEAVTILERKGGWMQVEAGGKTGWIRMLNVRLGGAAGSAGSAGGGDLLSTAALLRTGSSGKTVTTGVKGLGEEDIHNATVDVAQLDALAALAVDPADATAKAQKKGLKESQVEYLPKGKKN